MPLWEEGPGGRTTTWARFGLQTEMLRGRPDSQSRLKARGSSPFQQRQGGRPVPPSQPLPNPLWSRSECRHEASR